MINDSILIKILGLKSREELIRVVLCIIVFGFFYLIFIFLDKRELKALNSGCNFYTIMEPTEMPNLSTMRYEYFYDHQRYSNSKTVGSNHLGIMHTKESAMSDRYWVQASCVSPEEHIVLWKIPVPDTLKYVPPKGWKKIPYGLKEESVWFKQWKEK